MIACSTCGQENPAGARFCNACGAELVAAGAASRDVRKTVTVLFCDLAGYTSTGERLDPEALRRLQSRYFEDARAALERHGGTVEKFIGDAVMAVFGIPQLHEDDALRALRAAVELRQAVQALGLQARIGVNTGEVVAGSGDALVTGDAVNVAARLEQAAPPGEILLGEQTLRLARDAVQVESVEPLELKGKAEAVPAFRLVSVAAGAPAFERRLDAPLVGRARELDVLRLAFDEAVSLRRCRLVTVTAPPGIGKSRLALEFGRRVEHEAEVLAGHCLPYGEGITYWPAVEIFRAAGAERELETALHAVAAEETFLLIRKFLEGLARERPLVLVVDDIHWAEPTLLDLLEHVTDWTREAPILLLCLTRPDVLDRRPTWGSGRDNAEMLTLQPLSDPESDELIRQVLGGPPLEEQVRERVRAAAEGNPLFVEQLLAMLAEGGDPDEVPPTIQALLTARLDGLPPDEVELIERASVVGLEFEWEALAALFQHGRRPAGAQLAALVRKELIRPHEAIEDSFHFRHALIRDAAYERLPKQSRAELHERLGDRLDGTSHELEELVGYHLEQAHRYRTQLGQVETEELGRRAAARLRSAGQRAFDRADTQAAANLLERAAELLPERDPERLEILPQLGIALTDSGELSQATEVLEEAIASGRERGDRRLEYHSRVQLAFVRTHADPIGSLAEARSEMHEAIRVFEEIEDETGLAHAWFLVGTFAYWDGHAREAEVACEEAFESAERTRDRRQAADALWRLCAAVATGPTPADKAERRCAELVDRALGDRKVEAVSLGHRAYLAAMQGRFDEARAMRDRSKFLYQELGLRLFTAAVSHYTGYVEMLAGDFAAAEAEHRESYDLLSKMGAKTYLSSTIHLLAAALYAQGRYDEAFIVTEEAERLLATDDGWRVVRALVLARRGEHELAEAMARETVSAMEQSDLLDYRAGRHCALAEVLQLGRRHAEAVAEAETALSLYEQKGNEVMAERMRSVLSELAVTT